MKPLTTLENKTNQNKLNEAMWDLLKEYLN